MLGVPYKILMPLIVTISSVGIYATENNTFDMWFRPSRMGSR